jgi:hypothetical protein
MRRRPGGMAENSHPRQGYAAQVRTRSCWKLLRRPRRSDCQYGVPADRPASRFLPAPRMTLRYGELSWGRSFPCIGIGSGDLAHLLSARRASGRLGSSAQRHRRGMVWVGAGNSYPSVATRSRSNTAADGVYRDEQFYTDLANLAEAKGHRSCQARCASLSVRQKRFGREAQLSALGRGGVRRPSA